MADRELLSRIDRSLGRIDEHMARGNELMDDVRLEMQLTREAHRENMAHYEVLAADMREFMREILLRVEKGGERQVRALDELTDEVRAQREGLLRVLDRLGRNGPGDAPAAA